MTLPIGLNEMNATLSVFRPTLGPDTYGGGGTVVTLVEQAAPVPALVSEPTAAERVAAMQAGADLTIVVHFRPDADIRRGDELHGAGDVLRVKSTVTPSTPVYLRADCVRIQIEGQ